MQDKSPLSLRLTRPERTGPLLAPVPLLRSEGRARGAVRIAARRGRSLVLLDAIEAWAFEANGGLTLVHSAHGRLEVDVTLAEIVASAIGADYCLVHRSWLVNLANVKVFELGVDGAELFVGPKIGQADGLRVPVARDRVRAVREILLTGTIGLRRRDREGDEGRGGERGNG
jgi:DNA-binding LytR/AlgR family response regulator